MNVTVNRKALADALKLLAPVVKRQAGRPILEYIVLEAGGQVDPEEPKLRISGTNLAETVVTLVEDRSQVEGAGVCLAPFERLRSFVAADTAEEVTLRHEKGQLFVDGDVKARFRTEDVSEYPGLPEPPPKDGSYDWQRLPGEAFRSALRRSMAFVGEGKLESPGSVLVRRYEEWLALHANRGGHAAYRETLELDFAIDSFEVTPQIARLLGGMAGDTIEVCVTESQTFFRCGETLLASTNPEPLHPAYDRAFSSLEIGNLLNLEAAHAFELLCGLRTLAGIGGPLEIEHDGLGSLVVARGGEIDSGTFTCHCGDFEGEVFKLRTNNAGDVVLALEVLVGEGGPVEIRHDARAVRISGAGGRIQILLSRWTG